MSWLADWDRRKKITLTGGVSGAQTDYQLKLTVAYVNGMQTDFDDLRFTQANGITLIDSWLEEKTDSTSATVWVKFPTTPADGETEDYYMYYGNSGISSNWNIRNTMLDGDDFSGSSLDTTIWNSQYCNKSVADGELTLSSFTGSGGRFHGGIRGKRLMSPTSITEAKLKNVNSGEGSRVGLSNQWDPQADDSEAIHLEYNNVFITFVRNEGDYAYDNGGGWTPDQYYGLKVVANGTSVVGYHDSTTIGTVVTNIPDENMYLRLCGDGSHSPTIKCKWIFARKYAATPSTYEFGSEEGGPYWLTGWSRRRKITLTGGSSGAQTDFQLKLDIVYDANMCPDFDDLRFTQSDGETLIDAWLESKVDSTSAVVWIEFPTTPANTITEDYYMYYGNSGVGDVWNIGTTFLFGDDFTNDLSKWTIVTETPIINNNMLELSASDNEEEIIRSDNTYGINTAMRFRQKTSVVDMYAMHGMTDTVPNNGLGNGDNIFYYIHSGGSYHYRTGNNGTYTQTSDAGYHDTDWHIDELMWRSGNVDFYEDGSLISNHITNIPDDNMYVYLRSGYPGYPKPGTAYVDWAFIHKYTTNPPTYGFSWEEWEEPPLSINGIYLVNITKIMGIDKAKIKKINGVEI